MPSAEFSNQIAAFWAIVANTWWLWAPPALFLFGKGFWSGYLKARYAKHLEWALLEVRIPRDIAKTPEAMEQIFAGLQAMHWEFDPWETWWLGLQHDYLAFELASMNGETRFYIRVPTSFRNLIEAQVYAQYPDAEVVETADYLDALPASVPDKDWDLFGLEFKLEKPDPYPIRTYRDFVALTPGEEEFVKVDPFTSMVELLGTLGPGEHLGYHLLLRPVQTGGTDHWQKEGEALVNKMIGKKERPKKNALVKALEPLEPLSRGWAAPLAPLFGFEPPEAPLPPRREESSDTTLMQHLSPGTKDIVAAIERNITKPGFEVIIRMCYVARRDVFTLARIASFIGAMKVYNTQTLNGFKLNGASLASSVPWWLPSFVTRGKKLHKKSLYYQYYKVRKPFIDTWSLVSQFVVLNTEELATIYHYPGLTAKAPMMPRIEAKRAEPPATLPVG